MAHFAELDNSNTVLRVLVIDNQDISSLPFPASEPIGILYLQNIFGADTIWKQTSYNRSFRCYFAGEGFTYDANYDVFIPPKLYPSWILNMETFGWESPVPHPLKEDPNRTEVWDWDEDNQTWILIAKV